MSDQFYAATPFARLVRAVDVTDTRDRGANLRALGFDLDSLDAEARRRDAVELGDLRRSVEQHITLHSGGPATVLPRDLWSILSRARIDEDRRAA